MEVSYESSHEVKIKFTHRHGQRGIHRECSGEHGVYEHKKSVGRCRGIESRPMVTTTKYCSRGKAVSVFKGSSQPDCLSRGNR